MNDIIFYMSQAIQQAYKAKMIGEIPIGAVVVKNNKIIGRGYNQTKSNRLNHAEIIAINESISNIKSPKLNECSIFITCEPCIMCSGAILLAEISNVYYGCYEPKFGAAGSQLNLIENNIYNRKIKVYSGIKEDECKSLLIEYFKEKH